MALFNFSKPEATAGNDIQLMVNDETITVPAGEAKGLSVAELFRRFAGSICDTERINRYVALGRVVNGTSQAEEGTLYSAAIASESKG